jgi:uncharacterized spore protein YtfJ
MSTAQNLFFLTAYFASASLAVAQPLQKPLADFDRMVADLKSSGAVGEPVRVGNTTIVPFASVQFGLGSAGAAIGSAGGLGASTVPLGVVIVEGDDVRVELLPHNEEKPMGTMQQLIQGIIDKKLSFMVNGINLGNAPGTVADLVPMVNAMMGERNLMVNAVNLGSLNAPRAPGTTRSSIADLEAAAHQHPSAEAWYKLGEALRKAGQQEKAAAAYRNALRLQANYPDAANALSELKK